MNSLNDLKNKRKGIRNLISVTKSITSVPNTLFQNNEPITDPKKKKNIFNTSAFSVPQQQKLNQR